MLLFFFRCLHFQLFFFCDFLITIATDGKDTLKHTRLGSHSLCFQFPPPTRPHHPFYDSGKKGNGVKKKTPVFFFVSLTWLFVNYKMKCKVKKKSLGTFSAPYYTIYSVE